MAQALLVGSGECKLWLFLRNLSTTRKVQKCVSQREPLLCIIPPCHQREPHPYQEVQEVLAKYTPTNLVFPSWCFNCDVVSVLASVVYNGNAARIVASLPSHLDFGVSFGSRGLTLSF